jgi:hypothetical protein
MGWYMRIRVRAKKELEQESTTKHDAWFGDGIVPKAYWHPLQLVETERHLNIEVTLLSFLRECVMSKTAAVMDFLLRGKLPLQLISLELKLIRAEGSHASYTSLDIYMYIYASAFIGAL